MYAQCYGPAVDPSLILAGRLFWPVPRLCRSHRRGEHAWNREGESEQEQPHRRLKTVLLKLWPA